MKRNFSYKDSSGLIDINTLSPSLTYYYRVQAPVALNPSAFGCKIAFYNDKNELIYHRKDFYAHELHSLSEIEQMRTQTFLASKSHKSNNGDSIRVVNWSKQGNAVYILEYYHWNDVFIYESTILYLDKKYCYRINEMNNDFKIVNDLHIVEPFFDEDVIGNKLVSLGIKVEVLNLDSVKEGLLNKKWFPFFR